MPYQEPLSSLANHAAIEMHRILADKEANPEIIAQLQSRLEKIVDSLENSDNSHLRLFKELIEAHYKIEFKPGAKITSIFPLAREYAQDITEINKENVKALCALSRTASNYESQRGISYLTA